MARKKKKNFLTKFIKFIIFIVILVVIGYLGLRSYNEIQGIKKDIEEFTFDTPNEVTDKIHLPIKIGEKVNIEWESSNPNIITNEGVITPPDFEEGPETVTLTGKINVEYEEILTGLLLNVIKSNFQDIVFEVEVNPTQATNETLVKNVIERLTLIDETYSSIYLPTKLCYESINIEWISSNVQVMDNNGNVTTPLNDTLVTLTAKISSNNYQETKDFKIKVLSNDKVVEVIDDVFDDQAATSRYGILTSTNDVVYSGARIMEVEGAQSSDSDVNATIPSFVRLRNKDEENGKFEIKNILNPKIFSFDYKFSGNQKSESSKLIIYINNEKIEEIVVLHKEEFLRYTKDLSEYDNVTIKVEHIDEWSTDTYLDVDNVNVSVNRTIKDIEEWVINNTATAVTKSVILPFTSEYGGIITWDSNSSALSNSGVVNRTENSQTVTLTANIKYLDKTSQITIEVIVKGKGSVQELEVFFIDIGKYGAGDCGECTYIKFGDVDIIVDAGDHFESTIQAVTEAINQRLEDDVIEYVIATHPDGDHIGGMAALFENFTIETLIKFEGGYSTKKYENMEKAYKSEGCDVYQIKTDIIDKNKADKFISLSNEVYISFVDTTYYTNEESNGKSIVFTLNAYGTTLLMTGDADNASGHTDLEEKYQDIVGDIDILKVVHHGTANGTTTDFLEAIDPEVAIICNGNYLGNKHGHPTPTCLSNLYSYDSNIKVYAITGGGTIDGVANKTNKTYKCSSEDRFNQRNGLITLKIDNNGYSLSSEYFNEKLIELKDTLYYKGIKENGLI